MQYYSDSELSSEVANNAYLKAGIYYIKITASETMDSAPTISLTAEGTANDVTDAATILVSENDYSYTRTIAADVLAIGTVLEGISITGTDSAGNVSTDVDPTDEATKEIYTDTVDPVVSAGADAGAVTEQFTQDATTSDVGGSGIASYLWTIQDPYPHTVTFGTATAVDTTVSAAGEGFYTVRLTVTDTAGNSAYDDATFTWGAVNVPIAAYSPISGATDVAITDDTATITFGGLLDITLLDTTKVTLVNNDGTETSVKGTVTVSGGDGNSQILNIPYTGLENSHTYRINIYAGAIRDSEGHINSAGVSYFTTVAAITEPTEISVTNTALVKSVATKNGEFDDGWRWVLDVTVPTASTTVAMSFDDLTGAGTISATNIRFYSAESSDHTSASPIVITTTAGRGAGVTWSGDMTLDTDLSASTAGRQIQITVQAAVPIGSTSGAYSASYDIQASS